MSEPTNFQPETAAALQAHAQGHTGYATQPSGFRPNAPVLNPAGPGYNAAAPATGARTLKPYILGAVVAVLALLLIYQQTQINRLSQELSLVNDHLKSSDVRDRLDAHEAKLEAIDTRLTYLDSKITAADAKGQTALAKLKAQEDNDIFGNAIKNIKHTFGIQ